MGWFKNTCLFVIAVAALLHVFIELVGIQAQTVTAPWSPEMQRLFV
jgi:hypothetical protein